MKKFIFMLLLAAATVTSYAKPIVAIANAKSDTMSSIDSAKNNHASVSVTIGSDDLEDLKELQKLDIAAGGDSHWDVVGFAAIVSPFLAAFAIVLIVLIFNHRNKKAKYALMEKAIEAGRDIPQSFFEEEKKNRYKSPLQSALTLIGVGLGLSIMLFFLNGETTRLAFIGAIPFFIGVGKLVAYILEKKEQEKKEMKNDDKQI